MSLQGSAKSGRVVHPPFPHQNQQSAKMGRKIFDRVRAPRAPRRGELCRQCQQNHHIVYQVSLEKLFINDMITTA